MFTPKIKPAIHCLLFAILFNCLLPIFSYAQAGQWTWMLGANYPGNNAVYGTKTVFDSVNNPDGLYEACQWTDTSGNFWLFGGTATSTLVNNNLWKYDPTINQWAWMNGPGTQNDPGNYGTRGVPSATNVPPCRSLAMATWVDKNNNLWFFGGVENNTSFNDLWRYNISTNQWTWISGNSGVSRDQTASLIRAFLRL